MTELRFHTRFFATFSRDQNKQCRLVFPLAFNFIYEDCFEKAFHHARHIALGDVFCDLDSRGPHYTGLCRGSGDALLTYDSDTGLEWLDTTLTDGRSFTEVKAGWGGWTTTSGFRYATMAELRRLFVSAGVMPNFLYDTYSTPSDVTDVDRIIALTRLFGPTFIYEDEGSPLQRRSVMGFVADDYSDNPDYAGFGRYADVGFYQLGWTTYAWAQDGSSTQVQRSGQYGGLGSFLVRESVITPVPEPTTRTFRRWTSCLVGIAPQRQTVLTQA